MRVALRVHDAFGFEVVNGWRVAPSHPPTWHCFNRIPETGELADAAQARRTATGYLGRVLERGEVAQLRNLAATPTVGERLTFAGERFAGFERVLSGLLD